MANAANSPFVKHPALLALFAPRPPPPFKAPMPSKPTTKLTGIAAFCEEFGKTSDEPPPQKFETPTERRERIKKEKAAKHLEVLAEREKAWDPHNNPNATTDPYKTLFVARLSYELSEDDLRHEFERYGRIRNVKLIKDKEGKSRGYAFIEFERSNDLKEAFQHADGHKLKDRRILVDVERGRTVKSWKPRKLGGGLGKTRAGPSGDSKHGQSNGASPRHSSSRSMHRKSSRDRSRDYKSSKYGDRRSKYRDRDYRDRDRRSSRKDGRKRSRSRSRSRKDRDRDRKKSDKDRRRNGEDGKYGRKEGKDRDRARRKRSPIRDRRR